LLASGRPFAASLKAALCGLSKIFLSQRRDYQKDITAEPEAAFVTRLPNTGTLRCQSDTVARLLLKRGRIHCLASDSR